MAPDSAGELPPDSVVERLDALGEKSLTIDPSKLVEVCRSLKDRGFERLATVTAVDRFPSEPRFEVVYHLHSIRQNRRLRLRCRLGASPAGIDSVISIWRSADWYEREVFDLFGITFRGHPDLRRIMMPDDWEGHPLRKDYPVHGHRYSYKDE